MIKVILDRRRKVILQRKLQNQMKSICSEKIRCVLGYRGKGHNNESTVYYSKRYNIWYSYFEHNNRYWNGFGIGRPVAHRNNDIIVEINVPYKSVDRSIEGVFGEDDYGTPILLHRGGIGGGRKGIGKRAFMKKFFGDIQTCIDGERTSELCIVATLGSESFARQVTDFIEAVDRFKKQAVHLLEKDGAWPDFDFFDEPTGNPETRGRKKGIMSLRHGVVVNELARRLLEKKIQVGKNKYMDIYIRRSRQIGILFEVKTAIATHDLYKGVGQLLLYSIGLPRSAKLILVIPKRPHDRVIQKLQELGIRIMYFEWLGDVPIFPDLDRFIK